MAMSLKWQRGTVEIVPWKIDFERYNAPERNKFFQTAPEIRHQAG
jgi:hypothetical protein